MFQPERLAAEHDLTAFDCGVPSLNAWLQRTAHTAQAKGVAVTDVWADAGGGRLIVVDAIDDAAAGFYRHFGFREVPGTTRWWMKVATVRALTQSEWLPK